MSMKLLFTKKKSMRRKGLYQFDIWRENIKKQMADTVFNQTVKVSDNKTKIIKKT